MPAPQVAVHADESNIDNIVDAILSIAQNAEGIAWAGTTEWDFPAVTQRIGVPWLSVGWPRFVEYSVGYSPVGVFAEQADNVQMTWDIDVFAIAPYGDGDPTIKRTVTRTGKRLVQTFMLNPNVLGTCDEAKVGALQLLKVGEPALNASTPVGASANAPALYFIAQITIQAIESLIVNYSAPDIGENDD